MGASTRTVVVIICCAVALSACRAFAQDWPQWRGGNRDAMVTDFNTPEARPPTLANSGQPSGTLWPPDAALRKIW